MIKGTCEQSAADCSVFYSRLFGVGLGDRGLRRV